MSGAAVYRGRRLVEILEELRGRGLVLLYSSAVVRDDLVVESEPSPGDPRDMLERMLEPLGLEAREGPGGTLVIVPGEPPRARVDESAPGGRPLRLAGLTTDVVVTPGRHSLLDEEQTAPWTIDPAETLRVPNIGGDISRMVDRLPGIAAADNTAAFHSRGSLEGDTSLVLDGLELYGPYHLDEFQAPFSLVDSSVADRVELRNGGFTADRGDRHGAFLDISTAAPWEARAEIEAGTLNSRVSYGAPIGRGAATWLASFRAWYPEAFLDTLELGAGERLRPRFGDAYAKASWPIVSRALLSVHALLARDRLSWQEQGEEDNENVDAETDSAYVWLRLLAAPSSASSSETVLSGGRIDASRTGVAAPDAGRVLLDDRRDVRFLGLTHDQTWQVAPTHGIKAGVSIRHLGADYRYSNDFEDDPAASYSFASSPDGTSWGLYAAHRMRVSETLTTELGVRWDRQGHTDDDQLGPRLHVGWRPSERDDVRVALGSYSQSQRIHELHVEDRETQFLPAETSRQAEATYRHEFPSGLRLRVDAYRREIADPRPRYENLFEPLDLFPETSTDRVTVAPEEARLRGVEVLLSGDAAARLLWSVSYTRSSAEDRIGGAEVPRSWDQPHAGKFLLGYRWDDRWFASVAGTAHTGWPTTPVTAVGTLEPDGSIAVETIPGPRNSTRFPDYRRLDVKLRRSFETGHGRVTFTVDVINVTDRKNACCVDDLLLGEPAVGPVEVVPEYVSWLGITPTFQARWEF